MRLARNFRLLAIWLTALEVAFDLRFEQIEGYYPLDGYALALIRSRKRKRRIL